MRCLIVVDYQVDFVTGSLGFPAALRLEHPIAAKIARYHANGDQVVFTLDAHGENYRLTREGKYLPVEHCRRGTPGCALYGSVAQAKHSQDICFEKDTYGSPELFDWLRQQSFDVLEFVGVVTQVCVLANVMLAQTALPEASIVIDTDCVASPDSALHRAALDVLESLHIHVTRR